MDLRKRKWCHWWRWIICCNWFEVSGSWINTIIKTLYFWLSFNHIWGDEIGCPDAQLCCGFFFKKASLCHTLCRNLQINLNSFNCQWRDVEQFDVFTLMINRSNMEEMLLMPHQKNTLVRKILSIACAILSKPKQRKVPSVVDLSRLPFSSEQNQMWFSQLSWREKARRWLVGWSLEFDNKRLFCFSGRIPCVNLVWSRWNGQQAISDRWTQGRWLNKTWSEPWRLRPFSQINSS